jgi:FkbM family methyltransferase
VWRRINFRPSDQVLPLSLPWNCTINARSADVIGRSIATQGVYDLPLTEAIMRLTDAGDRALDVGGNIGYMALVLAWSAGPEGEVRCFEPNPALHPLLRQNASLWESSGAAPIQIEAIALSDRDGEAVLGFPDDYASNQGVASLEFGNGGLPVPVRRLDSMGIDRIGVMKVDVEGHEASVFSGATKLLAAKQIRDNLVEEHESYPARSHKILLDHGYQLFRLTRSTFRPLLLPPQAPSRQPSLPSNYLATIDPARAQARFAAWGWTALAAHPRSLRPGKQTHSDTENRQIRP